MECVSIDGSILEGGGQILRIAISLSAIKKIPVRIFNIRAGRKKPGLSEQHLKGLLLVRDMCNGHLKGAELGSQEISFSPGAIKAGSYDSRVKTAGSIALLMQISIPVALFAPAPSVFKFWGGTDADFAPTIDYINQVTLILLKKFGANASINLMKRGFFPRGGGEANMKVDNVQGALQPITLTDPGEVVIVEGTCIVGGSCPIRVGQETKSGAECILMEQFGHKIQPKLSSQQCHSDCPGSSLTLVTKTSTGCVLGTSVIGNRNTKPYNVGTEAAKQLIDARPGVVCLDQNAQDQVILPMALANGVSTILCGPLTLHTKTAIAIVEMLSQAKFEIKEVDSSCTLITCTGDPAV